MPDSPSKIKVLTLGCSKNTVDSEVLMRQLVANGYELSSDSEYAQIAVINTCGFIDVICAVDSPCKLKWSGSNV